MSVEDYLVQQNFVVQQHENIIFNENTYGPFDLVAYSDNLTLIIIALNNESNHDIDKILEIEKLSQLSNTNIKTFAITFYPHEALLKLLRKFEIVPLNRNAEQRFDKYAQKVFGIGKLTFTRSYVHILV